MDIDQPDVASARDLGKLAARGDYDELLDQINATRDDVERVLGKPQIESARDALRVMMRLGGELGGE